MPTLAELRVGDAARVIALVGDPSLIQRLAEMGLFDGERVEVLGFAPLGDPIEIRVGETRLSLRLREAAAVSVSLG